MATDELPLGLLTGPALFVLVSVLVGLRVLGLSLRTGQFPEFAIAITLLCAGGLGFPLIAAVPLVPEVDRATVELCSMLGDLGISTGAAMLYLFNWRIFRRDALWAEAFFLTTVCCMLSIFAGMILLGGYGRIYAERPAIFRVGLALQAGAFLWCACECFVTARRLGRRRAVLELGDPLVAHRLRWLGIGAGSAFLVMILYGVIWFRAEDVVPHPEVIALTATPGLLGAFAGWLAFFPPRFYRRLLGAR